ncbi:hypothetical protein [Flavihumibacter petaseus]|uniref:Uncharacterized protein n=1 Tax=Flavihumibacter petaseus NBRC 106054 TaxID=1220578 RepID=A0A0E9MY15_9BACT|nr:hypothetical protein [Flavihumibacter petaseus]GAO42015.1 hypothetical protein FPE01S_01_10280 [Flavihumibacter petaseus NBRC 106054]
MKNLLSVLLALIAFGCSFAQTFKYSDTELYGDNIFNFFLIPAGDKEVHLWKSSKINVTIHRFNKDLHFMEKTVVSRTSGSTSFAEYEKFYFAFHQSLTSLEVFRVEGDSIERISHSPIQDTLRQLNARLPEHKRYELEQTDDFTMLYRRELDRALGVTILHMYCFDSTLRFVNKLVVNVPFLNGSPQHLLLQQMKNKFYTLVNVVADGKQKTGVLEMDPAKATFRQRYFALEDVTSIGEQLFAESGNLYLNLQLLLADGGAGKGDEGYCIWMDSTMSIRASGLINATDEPNWKAGYHYSTGFITTLSGNRLLLIDLANKPITLNGYNNRSPNDFEMVRYTQLDSAMKPTTIKIYPVSENDLVPVYCINHLEDTYIYCEEKVRNNFILKQYQWQKGLTGGRPMLMDPDMRLNMTFSRQISSDEWLIPYLRRKRCGIVKMRF